MKKIILSHNYFLVISILATVSLLSCKKFVQVPPPPDQLSSELVFSSDNAATATITGIYSQMMNDGFQFSSVLTTLYAGMSADELYYYTPDFRQEFTNNEISVSSQAIIETDFWNPSYRYIYAANKIIEGALKSNDLSAAVRDRIIGEAKFIRAFCYFHLVNLFGDVPLILQTDYLSNGRISRSDKDKVYTQMISDLKNAENLLENLYPTANRTRPNKYAAAALLARVYLYQKDWINAEAQASLVIGSGMYSLDNDLNSVFLAGSNETIWQLKPVVPSRNTWEGYFMLPASNYSTPTYLLTNSLVDAFEPGDQRKVAWTKSRTFAGHTVYYPVKYKVKTSATVSEYYVVLRLAEQYLVRAEARAMQGDFSGAAEDINWIRGRAGLAPTSAVTQADILLAIEQERRVELFAEWGHRWFDLKRTARADSVLGAAKPNTWQTTDALWPIPQSQINLNPALTQNPGY